MADPLLTQIREFLRETTMSPSYFGKLACGNSELVGRLERGATITLATAEKLQNFMAARRAAASSEAAE